MQSSSSIQTNPVAGHSNNLVKCSMDSSQKAVVVCLQCQKYLCRTWDNKLHRKGDLKKHKRFPVASLKSYIALDTKTEGESATRRNWATRKGPIDAPLADSKTLHENFQRSVRLFGDRNFLGRRVVVNGKPGQYEFITYKQAAETVKDLGSGLRQLGVDSKTRVGLYSINRPEWCLADLACMSQSYVTVPLYDTLGPDVARLIVEEAEVQVIFCSVDKLETLKSVAAGPECACLKYVVVMPPQPCDEPVKGYDFVASKRDLSALGVSLVEFDDLVKLGNSNPCPFNPPAGPDLATLCYTSGTTGRPKGAMLSHSNIISDVAAVLHHGVECFPDDVHISFLPLAHMFERGVHVNMIFCGGSIGYFRGSPLLLLEDIEFLRPTIFVAVPRLYNRLYDKILTTINADGGIKKWLFEKAFAAKLQGLRSSGSLTHFFWDRIIFSKIAAKLGGRVRMMVTGSAPISSNVLEFLRVCFSCPVVEGYGMTESAAGAVITSLADVNAAGNVGFPIISTEIKLVDVPEMNYTSKDLVNGEPMPRGEVWMRGSNIFLGYYKQAEKTAEALTADGWLKSGDIGMWLPDQTLKIIDRKKNIFKLAQGEYIAPEKIENIYARCKFIAQMFVYGDSLQHELVAVVVPDEEELKAWAASKNITKPYPELVASPEVKALVEADMRNVEKAGQLKGFEKVKAIHLEHELFSVDNGLFTPTFKLKRNVAKEKYQAVLDAMYAALKNKKAPIKSNL